MVGRGGMVISWVKSKAFGVGDRWPLDQTCSKASSEGTVQTKREPFSVTIVSATRDASSIGSGAFASSLRPGRENARALPSEKTPTRAVPKGLVVTAAEWQVAESKDLEAPLAVAGLKTRISDVVTF